MRSFLVFWPLVGRIRLALRSATARGVVASAIFSIKIRRDYAMPNYKVKLKCKRKIAEGTMAFHFEKPAGFFCRQSRTIR